MAKKLDYLCPRPEGGGRLCETQLELGQQPGGHNTVAALCPKCGTWYCLKWVERAAPRAKVKA